MVKPIDPFLANILEREKIITDDTCTGKLVFDNAPTFTGHPTIEGITTTEYQESTLEKQEEFEKKRNYEWDQWKPIE